MLYDEENKTLCEGNERSVLHVNINITKWE